MRELIYLSKRKLAMFHPDRLSRSVKFTGALGIGPASFTIDISNPTPNIDRETTDVLTQAIKYLEREAVHFSQADLTPGSWIFFDLDMGYGTSYKDSGYPPAIDDVALFYGSLHEVETENQSPLDLLLCGSTEHLLGRTYSAGRMGSGTEWLYDLIGEVEKSDSLAAGELPELASPGALAREHINRPETVARWVFGVIKSYHSPTQYARFQGFARILFIAPRTELDPRLIVATPLFVQFPSSKPIGILARHRMRRSLSRHRGLRWRKWTAQLAPEDRGKVYIPIAERPIDASDHDD